MRPWIGSQSRLYYATFAATSIDDIAIAAIDAGVLVGGTVPTIKTANFVLWQVIYCTEDLPFCFLHLAGRPANHRNTNCFHRTANKRGTIPYSFSKPLAILSLGNMVGVLFDKLVEIGLCKNLSCRTPAIPISNMTIHPIIYGLFFFRHFFFHLQFTSWIVER